MQDTQPSQAQKLFLIGTIALGLLVAGGLIWAISLGPAGTAGGSETGLAFRDDNDPTVGPGDAQVVVRLFSDLQCPACRAAEDGVRYAMQRYSDRVRFVWNDFPLMAIHRNAKLAANAARCAEEQGKFWEFTDQLFGNQGTWADLPTPSQTFSAYAGKLGLNKDAFSSCLASQTYDRKVEDDMSEGRANRVDSTPTMFIGDKRFVGGLSKEDWDRELGAALDRAGASATKTPAQ